MQVAKVVQSGFYLSLRQVAAQFASADADGENDTAVRWTHAVTALDVLTVPAVL